MEIGKFNQMKAYLLKPKRLFTKKQDTIGGGTIQGENLGSRSGFADPITNEQFKKLYAKFEKNKKNIGTDAEFATELNKKYLTTRGNKFTSKTVAKKRSDLGVKTAVKKGEPAPAVMERYNKVNDYLKELIPKLNKEDKFYTQEQVSSMVEKKFNIEPRFKTVDGIRYKVNKFPSDKYPIMKTLLPVAKKLDNTLKNMLLEDKPLNSFWYEALGERTGLDYRTYNKYLPTLPTYQSIKDKGAGALKNRFNKTATHSFLKNKSFKDQLATALEMEKGLPIFTGKGRMDATSPRTKVMDFAKRNWNANRGKGDVVFYRKGSNKPITWDFGVTLPYNDVYFKYKGKKYNTKVLSDIDTVKQDFPEVYKTQTAINNLKRYEIVDPLNKNEKISVGKLIERNQINNYKWEPTGTLDILHGINGVKNEPFTNLNFNSRDINTLQRNIDVSINLPDNQKNKINVLLDKLTSGDPLGIVTRQANIARKGAGFNTMLNQIIDEVKNTGTVSKKKLSEIINVYEGEKKKLGKELNFYCNVGKITRVNTATGMVPGATCSAADIERGMKIDAKTETGRKKLLNISKKAAKVFGKFVAPIDIGIEFAFAAPHLLRGDAQGAIAATTLGMFGVGQDEMEQIAEKFGADSPEYALYGAENAIQQKMTAIAGLEKLLMENRQLGLIPEESGEFKKGIGRQPQEDALRKNFATSFINLTKLSEGATEDFAQYYPLIANLSEKNKAIQNIRGFSDEIQESGFLTPPDPKTIEGFLKTDGGKSKFPILPKFDLPALRAQATDYTGLDYLDRYSDLPITEERGNIAAQVPAYESQIQNQAIRDYINQIGLEATKQQFEPQGFDVDAIAREMNYVEPITTPISFASPSINIAQMKDGGRITFANGGRMSYAEGPEDPSKRKFLKNVGIGGGIAGGFMTGLLNLMDLFKGGQKGVVATKAAETEAEKIFLDLVDVVKNKGVTNTLKDPDTLTIGNLFQYKGVKVFEDGDTITVRFETDKGAPAFVEYRKPGYEVDPEAGTSVKTPGEFTYEAQETARYGPDGDVEMDFVEEVIDPIENIKDIAKEK